MKRSLMKGNSIPVNISIDNNIIEIGMIKTNRCKATFMKNNVINRNISKVNLIKIAVQKVSRIHTRRKRKAFISKVTLFEGRIRSDNNDWTILKCKICDVAHVEGGIVYIRIYYAHVLDGAIVEVVWLWHDIFHMNRTKLRFHS